MVKRKPDICMQKDEEWKNRISICKIISEEGKNENKVGPLPYKIYKN